MLTMPERLLEYEREWFLAVNGAHTWWFDCLMLAFASPWAWFPLPVVPLYFFLKRRAEATSLLVCTLLAGIANGLLTEVFFKPFFHRFRPVHHPSFMHEVRTVSDYIASGDYGFISGHSANAFAFAVLSSLAVKDKRYSLAILTWAAIMAYSRVYLGAHFITDIIPGMMAGALIGWLLYSLHKKLSGTGVGITN
ncbi:MAG: phosphatase PAP2 family protein [Tannerella sp.]|jgi:undecaprenyl-diphosphatase|nr:phosphatase PAP2 family protein [Tannerella sp.]